MFEWRHLDFISLGIVIAFPSLKTENRFLGLKMPFSMFANPISLLERSILCSGRGMANLERSMANLAVLLPAVENPFASVERGMSGIARSISSVAMLLSIPEMLVASSKIHIFPHAGACFGAKIVLLEVLKFFYRLDRLGTERAKNRFVAKRAIFASKYIPPSKQPDILSAKPTLVLFEFCQILNDLDRPKPAGHNKSANDHCPAQSERRVW